MALLNINYCHRSRDTPNMQELVNAMGVLLHVTLFGIRMPKIIIFQVPFSYHSILAIPFWILCAFLYKDFQIWIKACFLCLNMGGILMPQTQSK